MMDIIIIPFFIVFPCLFSEPAHQFAGWSEYIEHESCLYRHNNYIIAFFCIARGGTNALAQRCVGFYTITVVWLALLQNKGHCSASAVSF